MTYGMFSAIPKIKNKDTEPDESWDKILTSVLDMFDADRNPLPNGLKGLTKKDMKYKIVFLLKDIEKNKEDIKEIDCFSTAKLLIKLLKPGRTAILLVNKNEINYLKEKYGGK